MFLLFFLGLTPIAFTRMSGKATTLIIALVSTAGCAVGLVLGVNTYSIVSCVHKATSFLVAFVSTAVSAAGLLLPEDFLDDVCGPLPNTLRGLLFMGLICYGVVQSRQLSSLSTVVFPPMGSPGGGPTGGGAPPLTPLVYDRTENVGTTLIELQAHGGPVGHHCGFVRASGIDSKRPYEHEHIIWITALVLLGCLDQLNLPALVGIVLLTRRAQLLVSACAFAKEVKTPNFFHAEIIIDLFQQRDGSVRLPTLEVDTVYRRQIRAQIQKEVCTSKSAFSGNVHGLEA